MSNKIQTKAILFDFGGTLDTNGMHWMKVLWQQYQTEGIGVTKEQFEECYVYTERKLGSEEIILPNDNFYDVLRKKVDIETQYLVDKGYLVTEEVTRRAYTEHVAVRSYYMVKQNIARVGGMLSSLQNHYKLILVSNFYGNVATVIADFGINKYFSDVIDSAVVGIRKPDSGIYKLALERNNLHSDDAIIVGDSLKNDIKPAEEIGVRSVWLSTSEPSDENKRHAFAIISDILELSSILE